MTARPVWVTPSKLEIFRKFSDGDQYGAVTERQVAAAVRGERHATAAPAFSTAYRALLEIGPAAFWHTGWKRYLVQGAGLDHVQPISREQGAPAVTFRKENPALVYGCRLRAELNVGGRPVIMPVRCALQGLEVHELETPAGPLSFDRYARSAAWRAYLLASGAPSVQYNIFNYTEPEPDGPPADVTYTATRFYPYPALESDLKDLLFEFLEFTRTLDLTDYLYR